MLPAIKNTGLIVLTLGILFLQLGKSFIVLDYFLHKKYIATVLCENRNKPQMHCNGKCHLKKQLLAEQKNERQALNEKEEGCWWETNTHEKNCFVQFPGEEKQCAMWKEKIYDAPAGTLFRPPCE